MIIIFELNKKQYILDNKKEVLLENFKSTQTLPYLLSITKILLFSDKEKFLLGKPYLKNLTLQLEVNSQIKDKKEICFKFHKKRRYAKKSGFKKIYFLAKMKNIIS